MNINQMINRANNLLAKDPQASMQVHLPWTGQGDTLTLFKDNTGPLGRVVASGKMGSMVEFKAKDILAALHGLKCAGGTLQQAG